MLSVPVAMLALTGCSTMKNLRNKVADFQIQKKQLADGSTVYMDMNVTPTADWNCKTVGTQQSYNWAMIKTEAQFKFTSGYGLLMDNALAYANQQQLKVNYINLIIPEEKTFSVSKGSFTNYHNLNRGAQAHAVFYQCERINPNHQLAVRKSTNFGIGIGKEGVKNAVPMSP